MNTRTFVAISIVVTASALGAQKAPDITPYLIADRAAEVALARTPVIDATAGDPSSPMQVIYIPTRTWSDGTPAG